MDVVDSLRFFSCDLIQNAGILLKLPQTAMATAQMLLHRVYYTRDYTFDRYALDTTAMATLFLAAKVEDTPRKARDLIDVFTYVLKIKFQEEITLSYVEHERVREELITAERRILKNLGFNLLSSYPHKIIVNYYNAMVNALDRDKNVWQEHRNQKLIQIAWNYCNDSLRTDVFIKLSKEAVACACIQMACEDTQMFFPTSTDGREWYLLFTNETEVSAATQIIRNLYKRPQPNPNELKRYIYLSRYLRGIGRSGASSRTHRERHN